MCDLDSEWDDVVLLFVDDRVVDVKKGDVMSLIVMGCCVFASRRRSRSLNLNLNVVFVKRIL